MKSKQNLQLIHQKKYDKINNDFISAISCGYSNEIIEKFLNNGADINYKDYLGNTALIIAIEKDSYNMVQLLLKYYADINLCNHEGVTPLICAAKHSNHHIIELLLTYKTDYYSYHQNINVINIDAKDNNGLNALDWAIKKHHNEIVEILREHGATRNSEEITKGLLFIVCSILFYLQMWIIATIVTIITIYLYVKWSKPTIND